MAAGADERSLIALPTNGWSQPMIFWTTLCLKSVTKKNDKKGGHCPLLVTTPLKRQKVGWSQVMITTSCNCLSQVERKKEPKKRRIDRQLYWIDWEWSGMIRMESAQPIDPIHSELQYQTQSNKTLWKMIKTRQRTIVWNSDTVVRVLMWLEKSSSHGFVCVIAKKRK